MKLTLAQAFRQLYRKRGDRLVLKPGPIRDRLEARERIRDQGKKS